MRGAGMPLVQQPGHRLALLVTAFHRGLEQRLLDVPRQIAPHRQGGLAQGNDEVRVCFVHAELPAVAAPRAGWHVFSWNEVLAELFPSAPEGVRNRDDA